MSSFFYHRTPFWIQAVYPKFCWRRQPENNTIYLTFDDGPVPEATPTILNYLRSYQAKATFFCVGENVSKYQGIFQQLLEEGHRVANHTYHHLNGWDSTAENYLKDVDMCQALLSPFQGKGKKPMMRPPYGRLRRAQWRVLVKEYEIVMWDVLSGDFSKKINADRCLEKTIKYTKSGSIVLFHDSTKTIEKLESVLPAYLKHFTELGYSFQPL